MRGEKHARGSPGRDKRRPVRVRNKKTSRVAFILFCPYRPNTSFLGPQISVLMTNK